MKQVVLIFLIVMPLFSKGQCGFDQIHHWRLDHDPQYAGAVQAFDKGWANEIMTRQRQKMIVASGDTSYEIPLVLHVMHNGEAVGTMKNPSDSQLIALVAYVNAAFEASWPSYPIPATGGVRTRIRFVLAKVTSNCTATSGIDRVNASAVPGYTAYGVHFMGGTGPGVDDTLIRKLAYWDWTDYMNIWIVNKNDGPLSGYAGFPFYSAPSINSGVIISAGNATADNSTLVHELGHCLGLYHTFEGDNNGSSCPSLTNCTTTGDMICDTEPDKRFSDCSATINPCTGAPYNGVQFNFMNYSGCTAKFTPNQRDRMQYYLATFWNKLRYSRAGDSILTGTLTPASCITTASSPGNTSSDGPLRVSFNGIYRVSQGYNGDGNRAYVDNTCSYRTQVVPGGTYGLAISVSGAIQKIRAYIDYNNDGVFQVPAELVYSTTTSRNTDTVQTSIIIPTSGVTLNKPLRMRIVSDLSSNSNIGPCGALLTGQAEDYALVVSGSAGVNSGFQKRPGVYPNPANRYITIEGALGSSAILMNVEGQRVMQFEVKTDRLTVDIAPLPMGNYILQFTDAKGNRGATRIVKQ